MGMPRESGGMIFIPRPHRLAGRDAILSARRGGRPGFLLGDLTGLGKTLSVWAALAAMPEDEILVVCPKGGMPQRPSAMPPAATTGVGKTASTTAGTSGRVAIRREHDRRLPSLGPQQYQRRSPRHGVLPLPSPPYAAR